MGPVSAKSYPGRDLVRPQPPPAGRARQEIDYGRRGKGYIFGAFCPATGAAFTQPYPGRGTRNWVAFLETVEDWLPAGVERIYAIADNLSTHRATDVLLFMLAHPRWEMVFQPKYAAYLNLVRGTAADAIGSSRGGRCCARSPSRDGASRPGTRSEKRSTRPQRTGTRTVIPSSGAAAAVIAPAASPASPSCRRPHDLPDEPLRARLKRVRGHNE
jgi:DDE superfamily endonuclease